MKTTLLIGNGNIPSFYKDFLENKNNYLMAVDGGANFLAEKNILPNEIIGDLDSIKKENFKKFQEEKIKITHIKEQETTDLEKAIYSKNSDIYICLGFWSEEVSHSLNNLHILQKYLDKRIIFITEKSLYFLLPKKGKINLPQNTRTSIHPLTKTIFKISKGLQYSLENKILETGETISVRNKISKNYFKWEITEGKSLIILPAELRKNIIT